MQLKNKKIFITGGSAGIGKSLLKEFSGRGVKDIAVMGRRMEPMEQLQKEFPEINFILIQGDVGNPTDIRKAIQELSDKWNELDILVNNAGVVSASLLSELSDDDIINQININLTGLILLTKKALPLLKKSEEGAIINVSSGLGYIAMPFYNVYAATKAGVKQFSDAMRRELFQYPIHIMTIYPTATATPMMEKAKVNKMEDPDDVAKRTVEALIKKEINVIFGGEQRIKDIHTNFNEPREMDKIAQERFEALRERTEKHRAM
ncbi:MAG: SDR family NAD(P)-dependent oxidoreductase [Candidatus Cyclobacteriaceae bacterium M2_1C_046]